MKQSVSFFLDEDTIGWINKVAATLSRQRNREVTKSEAVEYLVMRHWKKTLLRQQEMRHELRADRKHAAKLLGVDSKRA